VTTIFSILSFCRGFSRKETTKKVSIKKNLIFYPVDPKPKVPFLDSSAIEPFFSFGKLASPSFRKNTPLHSKG